MKIRAEENGDINRIEEIILSAFKDHPHSNQKEHLLVSDLRQDNALVISLVALVNKKIVAHIAFSKVTINGQDLSWYGLAPVSVDPEFQNQGIGSKLITSGLESIRNTGANGCVLLGEPEYYGRFGFKQRNNLTLADVPAEYFLIMAFHKDIPSGNVEYNNAFSKNG